MRRGSASIAANPVLIGAGTTLGVIVAVLVTVVAWIVVPLIRNGGSNRTMAISVGGGLGLMMFMNVWMIIWPLQKKIIAATKATATEAVAR